MMLSDKYLYGKQVCFFALLTTMLFMAGCKEAEVPDLKKPDENNSSNTEETASRQFVLFDAGQRSEFNYTYDEKSSTQATLHLFDAKNEWQEGVLEQLNPYVNWGYLGFLDHVEDHFVLSSSMSRISRKIDENDLAFKPEGRISILSDKTLKLTRQITFRAYRSGVGFPCEIFAFNTDTAYLHYRDDNNPDGVCTTYKLDLRTGERSESDILSLRGKVYGYTHVYGQKMYTLDKTIEYRTLMEFDPISEQTKSYDLGSPLFDLSWEHELLYLNYQDGGIAVYSLSEHKFKVPKFYIEKKYGNATAAAFDKRNERLFLAFQNESVRPYIYCLYLSDINNDNSEKATPTPFAKLDMLTSDSDSGKTQLYIDPYYQQLIAIYYHSAKWAQGGRCSIFDIKEKPKDSLAQPIKHHCMGKVLVKPQGIFFSNFE